MKNLANTWEKCSRHCGLGPVRTQSEVYLAIGLSLRSSFEEGAAGATHSLVPGKRGWPPMSHIAELYGTMILTPSL